MLDDRVMAVLRRLEEETERDDPNDSTDARSLQVPPSSGALLFALASGRPGCEVLELGGSRGYSTIWLGAAVRAHGGHVTSLEASPVKLAASARNIADAGLGGDDRRDPG
jgi:predicted O-methyltransferase YrrM